MNPSEGLSIYFNGRFLPATAPLYSSLDRGLRFGEGLFETLLCVSGEPLYWSQHWRRLTDGLRELKLSLSLDVSEGYQLARELLRRCGHFDGEARLRITCTGGNTARGAAALAEGRLREATLLLDCARLSPRTLLLRQGAQLTLAPRPGGRGPLAHLKGISWLTSLQALEASRRGEEPLLHRDGFVLEGASTNLFFLSDEGLVTPPATSELLPGTSRARIFEAARELSLQCSEQPLTLKLLRDRERVPCVALSNALLPITLATHLDGAPLAPPPCWWHTLVQRLQASRARS